jgi:transcriptional regulator with XRE-family HTH domain
MKITSQASDQSILVELGERIAQTRLERNLSQAAVAAEAGIGVATLERLESGRATRLDTFVRVLRALGLIEALDQLVPAPLASPIEQLKLQGRRRRRAGAPRRARVEGGQPAQFQWGDEGPAGS